VLKGIGKEATYFYHPDHLGSVSVVSNHKGEPYERVEYLPFGEVWIEDVDAATRYIPFRFTSKELDRETGLYYYGARYYEPKVSRWMSADPAGWELINPMDEDGEPVPNGWPEGFGPDPSVGMRPSYSVIEAANWYAYVNNNPVKYVDPTGEEITVQIHRVFGDNFHASIKITPENQEKYRDNEHIKTDENGKLYLTLGAEPIGGKLVSDMNRGKDLNRPKVETVIVDLEGKAEDEVISALLGAEDSYGDDVDYDLLPKTGDDVGRFRDGYNSNSYVSGILKSVGLKPPEVESKVPGYDKPLPKEHFEKNVPKSQFHGHVP